MRIPNEVSREDYLAAVKPLLDLLGVDANEVFIPIVITESDVTMSVVAREKGDEESAYPRESIELADRPQDFASLAHHIVVKIA